MVSRSRLRSGGLVALFLLVGIVPFACTHRSGPDAARTLLAEAERLAAGDQEVDAARLLASRVEALPVEARAEVRLAIARYYHRVDSFDTALENAERALRGGSRDPEALFIQGDSLRRLQRLSEAESILRELLSRAPDHPRAQLSLACLLFRAADAPSALGLFEGYFRRAVPDDQGWDQALLEYGRALRAAGKFQESADRFMMVLERDPLLADAYSELAASLFRMKLRSEARSVEEIYRLISQNAFDEHVEKGLQKTGSASFSLAQRAANRLRERRFAAAFGDYRRAVEIDPRLPRVRILSAELSLRFRRLAEAEETINRGLVPRLEPASGLLSMKARLRLEVGDFPAARSSAEAALAALAREGAIGGPEKGQAHPFSLHLIVARTALEQRDLPGALRGAEGAAAAFPESWEPHYWRGRAFLAQENPATAIESFSEALRRGGSGFPDLSFWLAEALQRAGRGDEAVNALNGLLRSHPGFLQAPEALTRLLERNENATGQESLAALENRIASLREARDRIEALEKSLDTQPLERSGETYLELGKLYLRFREPSAYEFLFLASDLLPQNSEVIRLLLSAMKRPQDVFVRLPFLRKLLILEPDNGESLAEMAQIYLKLHVRLDEAARLAEGFHALKPTPRSFLLQGEIAHARGDRDGARKIFEGGLRAFPDDAGLKASRLRQ